MFIIHLCLHVHLNILIVHFDNVVEKKEKETDKVFNNDSTQNSV